MIPPRRKPAMFVGSGIMEAYFAQTFGQAANMMDGPLQGLLNGDQNLEGGNFFGTTIRDEGFDSKSSSDNHDEGGGSSDDHHTRNDLSRKRRKRYHRHTLHQIHEMEAFFKEYPHPDDKQRKRLSLELGMEPLQIKFWFQNKRTQMKMHHERHENAQLRAENEKLRAQNLKYREAISKAPCFSCGGLISSGEMPFDGHQLMMENEEIRKEINRISALTVKLVPGTPVNHDAVLPVSPEHGIFEGQESMEGELDGVADHQLQSNNGHADHQVDKQLVVELAVAAMDELISMAKTDEPLWIRGINNTISYVLNQEEYGRTFPGGIGPRLPTFECEASRETAIVLMNQANLTEILMSVDRWLAFFSGIVARAATLEILSAPEVGNYDGAMQVMAAEFQVLSPVVPTRATQFVRYCKHNADGTWAVVDVSLDSLRSGSLVRFRRRPSGCLIQDLSHGYAKVTWIEHVEVDDRFVPNMYRPLVNSGLAFGAKRWLATLDRQCDRLATVLATNVHPGNLMRNIDGRRGVLKLAERMVRSFFGGVSASTGDYTWSALSGSGTDDIRIMTQKSMADPGRPPGIVISAATSFRVPIPPQAAFDFLYDEQDRTEWDILSTMGVIHKIGHIASGREICNSVSLLRVNSTEGNRRNSMLIVQESCNDPTGSFIVYAPVDFGSLLDVLKGGEPDNVALLPSGIAILPDGPNRQGGGLCIVETGTGGSLLTVAFQILVNSAPDAKLTVGSVATVNNLIVCTVERIKASMGITDG